VGFVNHHVKTVRNRVCGVGQRFPDQVLPPIAPVGQRLIDRQLLGVDEIDAPAIEPGRIEVDTRVIVPAVTQKDGKGVAELIAEVETARYAYGLPLFLALLFAARGRHMAGKALAGYVLLLVPQAFSIVFSVLKQIIVAGGSPAALGIAAWQMEGIALGYQFGSLLLPTLAPVLLWLWFDHAFFSSIIVEGWLEQQMRRGDGG
jgi:hypothetical protein